MTNQLANGGVIPLLISGGARSGKSDLAEKTALVLAEANPSSPIAYIATAQATDPEFTERIAQHQARRSERFKTIEEPLALEEAIDQALSNHSVILVECMATWLGNLQYHLSTDGLTARLKEIRTYLSDISIDHPEESPTATLLSGKAPQPTDLSHINIQSKPVVVFVTNETGLWIVPATPEARSYRDHLGRLNQHLAAISHGFFFCISGIPVRLK